MESYEIYDLLRKRASGRITETEQSVLDNLSTKEYEKLQIEQIEFIMGTLDLFSSDELDRDQDKSWNEIQQHLENTPLFPNQSESIVKTIISSARTWIYAVAACLLVFVAAFLWISRSNEIQIYETIAGQQQTIELSDGSLVTINGASTLKLKNKFGRTNRMVELSGEGHFQVTKSEIPFIVNSNSFTIEVLGTVFNVMDYPDENLAEVKLSEGHISLTDPNEDQLELRAGQSYRLETIRGSRRGTSYQNAFESSWHKGIIRFNKHELSCAFRELEHFYGISIDDSQLQDTLHYTNTFVNKDIETILQIIERSAGITISNLSEGKYQVSQ